MNSGDDQELTRRVIAALDEADAALPPEIAARLAAARRRALAEPLPAARFRLAPLGFAAAAASIALLAVLLYPRPPSPDDGPPAGDLAALDLELLAHDDLMWLEDDLEFYAWLHDTAAGPG